VIASPVITASALGLTRNESGRRFPHAEDASALVALRAEILELLVGPGWEKPWYVYDLDEMTGVEIEHMVERGLMTPTFSEVSRAGRGFAVYGDGDASLEVNGDDHLRILGFRDGGQLAILWALLNHIDDRLETAISYAFDPRWGYLTARPRQAGSGMRAYATLLLPALALTGRLAGTAVDLAHHGMGMMALWGGAGGVVQLSNVLGQGKSEEDMLREIGEVCRGILEKERSVRKMLVRESPVQSRDQIGRAIGAAQQAWIVSFHEAVNLISAAQVGLELGLVEAPGLEAESAFGLMCRLQPAHIVVDTMDRRADSLESSEIDEQRARLLRDVFAGATVRA
jgi:protein arginine kinase